MVGREIYRSSSSFTPPSWMEGRQQVVVVKPMCSVGNLTCPRKGRRGLRAELPTKVRRRPCVVYSNKNHVQNPGEVS